ncbi:MAG: ABC transporter permease [Planctomycetota bacterium]
MTSTLTGLGEVFVLGVRNLTRNKLRSFLTMLGMIFGVGSVIAMLAVGAGARAEILARISELGVQNIIVNSVKPPEESKPKTTNRRWIDRYGLTFKDRDIIEQVCPGVERILPVNAVRQRLWYQSHGIDCSVLGVDPEHLRMFGLEVRRGRTFNEIDASEGAKVCIVRPSLVHELETLADPIGLSVRIGNEPYVIIGVLDDARFSSHTKKALAIDGQHQEVYIPYTSSMRDYGTMTILRRAGSEERSIVQLDQIVVRATNSDAVAPTARVLGSLLARFHEKKDYEIVVPLELLRQKEQTQAVFNVVMVLIAAISLLVGGIGIANIMLATITERTKEIGIRRAMGARRVDILLQFLTETAAIGVVGGLFGCLFGLGAIWALVHLAGWQAVVAWSSFALALSISLGVAIVSGIYPARRAARMDPIAALRFE